MVNIVLLKKKFSATSGKKVIFHGIIKEMYLEHLCYLLSLLVHSETSQVTLECGCQRWVCDQTDDGPEL